MIKFTETYKNPYSKLLDDKKNENKYIVINNIERKTIIFQSKYQISTFENDNRKFVRESVELEELEWGS